jgi:DNA-binding NarL/FixJ family response regulator
MQRRGERTEIVVMDLSMPGLNGLGATEQLRERVPTARIVILSVHEDATFLQRALDAGARGYGLKRAWCKRRSPMCSSTPGRRR